MDALKGVFKINGRDLWTDFGIFLAEEHAGDHNNYSEILKPAKVKKNVAVAFREEQGERYANDLQPRSEGRDVELLFAITAPDKSTFIQRYKSFLTLLKPQNGGWLSVSLPGLGLTMRMFYLESSTPTLLTAVEGEAYQASLLKVKFREPVSSF